MLNLSGFKLTFDDEFNKLSLDNGSTGTWQPAYSWAPNGTTDSTMTSWTMSPTFGPTSAADANVYSVNNGALSIGFKPTPADVNRNDVGGQQFLSGQLTTHRSFSQLYGYFEANMKLPAAAGLNSAFWLLPADGSWPPELDVVELLGNNPTTSVMTAHSQASGGHTANPHWANIPDASQAFHSYGVDWEPDKLTWYFDGKQVAQENTPADMNKPMYLLLDTLSGTSGSWIGAPNPGETAQMDVNYVRAYSSNANAAGVTAQPGYVPDNGAPGTPVTAPPVPPAPVPAPPPIPVATAPSQTSYITPGNGSFNDAAGNSYSIDASKNSNENGKAMADSSNTGAMDYANGQVYGQDASSHSWYTWNQSTWTAGSAPPAPTPTPIVTGSDTLVLSLSEDAWQGDAQFSVAIDGKTLGPAQSVTALHASGAVQDFAFATTMAAGTHDLAVSFLNDAYGGTPTTDRNLYVNAVVVNSATAPGAAATLFSSRTQHFSIVVAAHA